LTPKSGMADTPAGVPTAVTFATDPCARVGNREHFVEGILYAAGAAAGLGFCGGAFAYLVRGPITEVTVMNLGIFFFLFALNGNFRHYHVSFRYPRWLERWLQSPGMHHVHHSYLPRHRDRNLGLVTSIWDRMVGTLHIGEPYEATPWGLGPEEQERYTTFLQNVIGPFQEVFSLLIRREPGKVANRA
jgi:sterol desaturase/sphingolipid hydroxylase (fatty acid hydroxylase superfamily)